MNQLIQNSEKQPRVYSNQVNDDSKKKKKKRQLNNGKKI